MSIFDLIPLNLNFKKDGGVSLPDLPKGAPGYGTPLTLADIVAPSAIGITSRELELSGKLVRSFFIVSFPRYLTDGWLEPIQIGRAHV